MRPELGTWLPVEAITEKGHDKEKCWNHAGVTCADFVKQN
jgi:hypothetical protein